MHSSFQYETDESGRCRFVLGPQGDRTLLCFGVNPSTATPEGLDPTTRSVDRLSRYHGFDGWLMLNLYPLICTDPNRLPLRRRLAFHRANLAHIEAALAAGPLALWAAWGVLIEKRPYLPPCLRDIVALTRQHDCQWVRMGKLTKAGHPRHPLYLKTGTALQPFDISTYLREVICI
jgi:hypothetical protein